MNVSVVKTKVGTLRIEDDGLEIKSIQYVSEDSSSLQISRLADRFTKQLDEYFSHKRTSFDIPFSIEGTPFQRDVYIAMSNIPYGQTMSYQELARKAGYPNAQRAVGSVCRKNVFPFLLPCHRVINQDGSFGKYGGSPEFKAMLILHERQ